MFVIRSSPQFTEEKRRKGRSHGSRCSQLGQVLFTVRHGFRENAMFPAILAPFMAFFFQKWKLKEEQTLFTPKREENKTAHA